MKKPWYPWHPGDWRADVKACALDYEQRGVYRELLDLIWCYSTEESFGLPDNDTTIARSLGINITRWRRLRAVLIDGPNALLVAHDGVITSARLSESWKKVGEKSELSSESARIRWERERAKAEAEKQEVLGDSERESGCERICERTTDAMRTHMRNGCERNAMSEIRSHISEEGSKKEIPATSTPALDDDEPELPTLKPLTQFTEFRLSTAHYQIAESLYGWDRAETKRNTEAWKISRRKKRDHAVSDYNADWQGYLDARYRIDQKDAKASSNGNGRPERLPDAGIWILPSNVERPMAAGPDYLRVSVNGYVDWFPPDKLPAGAKEWKG